jgi:hypothetical protein
MIIRYSIKRSILDFIYEYSAFKSHTEYSNVCIWVLNVIYKKKINLYCVSQWSRTHGLCVLVHGGRVGLVGQTVCACWYMEGAWSLYLWFVAVLAQNCSDNQCNLWGCNMEYGCGSCTLHSATQRIVLMRLNGVFLEVCVIEPVNRRFVIYSHF